MGEKMRLLIITLLMTILSACSGSGVKSYSTTMLISEQSEGSVFVLRDTGYIGSVALMKVSLNGRRIGEIGRDETAVGKMSDGNNYLEAEFTGIAGMGMNSVRASFPKTGKENKYFIVKLQQGLFSNELEMFEVKESRFKSSL